MWQGLKSRLQRRRRPGTTSNEGMYTHVDFMISSLIADTSSTNENDMDVIGIQAYGDGAVLSDVDEEDEDVLINDPGKYVGMMKRNIFPCKTEEDILKHVMDVVLAKKATWQVGVHEHVFVCGDGVFLCQECQKLWITEPSNASIKKAKLHTLHHGCIRIGLQYNMCQCRNFVRYGGLSDGIFRAAEFHVFTR